MTWQQLIDKYYPGGTRLRDIYLNHCRAVGDLALAINSHMPLPLDASLVEAAAMLHDIGIFMTDAPGIECHGKLPYIAHGVAGAGLLRREGFDERLALVCERHTGSGLTADDIRRQKLPLPERDYLPVSTLERLICYADKFFSKGGGGVARDVARARSCAARFGEESLARFDSLNAEFGPYLTDKD